jgi:hypothetical protein
LPQLTDNIAPKGLKLIQYGPSGAGKSVRAAKFAAFGPVYFFDFDNKMDNLKLYLDKKFPEMSKKISYDTYRGGDADVVERVNTKLKEIQSGKTGYATVVFDSWTQWERTYFDHLLARFQNLGGKNWGEARQVVDVSPGEKVVMPGTADHQLKNRAFPEFIDRITALPLNVVVNCHVKEVMKGPATIEASGATAQTLPKYFNEWHYLYSERGFYKVRVKANEDFLANSARQDVPLSGVLDKDDLEVYAAQLVRL